MVDTLFPCWYWGIYPGREGAYESVVAIVFSSLNCQGWLFV